jgi:hypothetical protein
MPATDPSATIVVREHGVLRNLLRCSDVRARLVERAVRQAPTPVPPLAAGRVAVEPRGPDAALTCRPR